MKAIRILLSIILLTVSLMAINIDRNTSGIDILRDASLYIDDTRSYDPFKLPKKNFVLSGKTSLELGFLPKSALWIEFRLKNTTGHTVDKLIEYAYPETESVIFYDGNTTSENGMWHIGKGREHTNPYFRTTLRPYEERTFYIRAYAPITPLIVELKLWNEIDFVKHDFRHQTYLFIFFSALLILLIYNGMLLLFTRDRAYLYYILYLAGVIFFESIYLGIAQLYWFSNEVSVFMTKATLGYISGFVAPMTLFAREFLHTGLFPRIDRALRLYLWLIPFIVLLSFDNIVFDQRIMAIYVPLGVLLIFTGIHAYRYGQRQAKYYLVGWSVVITAMFLSVFKSLGYLNINHHVNYTNEMAFTIEALLFSIALAHRIKLLNEQKREATFKLIRMKEEEQGRLENLVEEKTKELRSSLQERELLYKELNHRVKNNLAMIISLIRLQKNKSSSRDVENALGVTGNRIFAISELYDNMNLQANKMQIDTRKYFGNIIDNIRSNYDNNVTVELDIRHDLELGQLVYCGLILNELVTNAFKYAFEQNGEFRVSLSTENGSNRLVIADNGVGFDPATNSSLGHKIVQTLAEKQLEGKLQIDSAPGRGTTVTIVWSFHLSSP